MKDFDAWSLKVTAAEVIDREKKKQNNPTMKFAVWQAPSALSFQSPEQPSGEKGAAFLRLVVPAAVLARDREQSDTLLVMSLDLVPMWRGKHHKWWDTCF